MNQKLKIKVGFFSILLSLALIIPRPDYFPALFLAVSIHELGHILGAKISNISLRELKLGIFGAGLSPASSIISYKKEILLSLLGPLSNFISIISIKLIVPDELCDTSFFNNFLGSSLALGVLNLLPVDSFDGGRILTSILSLQLSPKSVTSVMNAVSFIIIFLLWTLSVYLLLRVSSSLSLFIFSAYLFSKFFIRDTLLSIF